MLVKIKRDTIKLNPNRGQTRSLINLGPKTGTITVRNGNTVTEYVFTNLMVTSQKIDSSVYLEKPEFSIDFGQQFQELWHNPLPKFNFEYENIECPECKSTFLQSELECCESLFLYEYGDFFCPSCKHVLELEYEKIEDINDIGQN